jgi:hypothetical protein
VTAPTLGKRDVADERVRIFTGKNENELAEAAEGDFLVFLSEKLVPTKSTWLKEVHFHFCQ